MQNPLYIAEKPDMAKKIAQHLPGPHKRGEGYIETGAGIVTWAIGHLLGQAQPEEYDEKYKKWVYADLPILPQTWKMEISSGKSKQMGVIKNLLKNCSDVVNAGDPGREGQLIVDEILEYYNNKKPVWRLLLNSLDKATVVKALANLQPNGQFFPLYEAALGRQRADWIVGLNLTRAYTLLGRQYGYPGVLSVGRVQTPTLAIVVRREEEIQNFVPQTYYDLHLGVEGNPYFKAKFVPPKMYTQEVNGQPKQPKPSWLDDTMRICDKTKLDAIIADIPVGSNARVLGYSKTRVQEHPPLPFELSDIQSKMNAKHGASVSDTLEACQGLYEKGYASYPRTDCSYLPTTQHVEAPNIFKAIAQGNPQLASLCSQADPTLTSSAWNDSKLGEHHGIIPTAVAPNLNELSELEKKIYEAISQRYLAQFFPPSEVDKVVIELEAGSQKWLFVARGRTIVSPGWRQVYGAESDGEDDDKDDKDKDASKEDDGDGSLLPVAKVGQEFPVKDHHQKQQQTKPPSRYSEGTLMQAMKHVDRLVTDPNEKKMLKTVQGIGRAATRANIISTLIKRGYLEVQKKQLHPTQSAKTIVHAVDKALSDPGLTARWEQALDAVAQGKLPLATFQQKQELWIKQLLATAQTSVLPQYSGPVVAQKSYGASKGGYSKTRSSNGSGNSSSVSYAKKASTSRSVKSSGTGSGSGTNVTAGQACPKCGKPMAQRTVKNGPSAGKTFLGCTGFPNCKHSIWP